MGLNVITGDLLRLDGVVRHNQEKLTRLLLDRFVMHRAAR